MQRTISVHETTIQTATVDIKTVRIGKKQMTMGVFRQLKNERLLDPSTGELLGVPWGLVNYFWGDCKEGDHLHVVWQRGEELRRSCVVPDRSWTNLWGEENREQNAIAANVSDLLGLVFAAEVLSGGDFPKPTAKEGEGFFAISYKLGGLNWMVKPESNSDPAFALAAIKPPEPQDKWVPGVGSGEWVRRDETPQEMAERHAHRIESLKYDIKRKVAKVLKRLEEEGLNVSAETTRDGLFDLAQEQSAVYARNRAAYAAADKRWSQHYKELAALDQLFIAV